MRPTTTTTIATWTLLIGAGAVSFVLPDRLTVPASSAAAPDAIQLTGIVRDFMSTHPDFDVTPSNGWGHYAGNVSVNLDGDYEIPVFTGSGYRVSTQWRDNASRPIAPHLYSTPDLGTVRLVSAIEAEVGATIDSWDSTQGPYGGTNVYPAPTIQTGAAMPAISVPTINPDSGNVTYNTATLSTDLRCNDLTINSRLTITGNVRIVVENDLRMKSNAQLQIADGASLELYLGDEIRLDTQAKINSASQDYTRCTIYNYGDEVFEMRNSHAQVYATLISPDAPLEMNNWSAFYGRFTGETIIMDDHSLFHMDYPRERDECGTVIYDAAGSAGAADTGAITDGSSFGQWYQDVPGVNLSKAHVITMVNNGLGVYEFFDAGFYLADDELLGNEGGPRNNFFTYTLKAEFTYDACTGQFFELEGDDDIWFFIDGKLVIDLGGMRSGQDQSVMLDRLGLVDGTLYALHLFYAHRQGQAPTFRMRTNVPTVSTYKVLPAISAAFD